MPDTKPDFLNEPLGNDETKDNLELDGKVKPKIDIKKSLEDKFLRFKSIEASASIHAEVDEDNVEFDANISMDLQKLYKEDPSGLKGLNFKVTKKF